MRTPISLVRRAMVYAASVADETRRPFRGKVGRPRQRHWCLSATIGSTFAARLAGSSAGEPGDGQHAPA